MDDPHFSYMTKLGEKKKKNKHLHGSFTYLLFQNPPILYIKANMVSVCVDKNWAVPGRFFQSLPVPCGAGDKQGRAGRPGQPLWGAARGAISILKNPWGKPGDLHLIKQKYNFKKKFFSL
jgi:hypothetical protein